MGSIQEAKHYIDNAKEILQDKARKENGYYQDSRYVKMAGHMAYTGVLVALDEFLGKKRKGRKDVHWYKQHLSQLDTKALNAFLTSYQVLNLDMAYDGAKSAKLAAIGLNEAEKIISWIEKSQEASHNDGPSKAQILENLKRDYIALKEGTLKTRPLEDVLKEL